MGPTAPEPGCFGADVGWSGAPLDTARLRLRAPRLEDAEAVARGAGEWDVARFTANIPHPLDAGMVAPFLADLGRKAANGEAYVMLMERRLDREVIGAIGFEHKDGGAEIGYWVAKPYWGSGYATEAALRLLRLIFRNFDMPWVAAEVLPENVASIRVLEKLGFASEGEVARELPARGRSASLVRYRLTRATWAAREAAKPMVLVAAVAMVDVDGRVLLAERPAGKMMAGLWEFPGGKVHAGETPEAALIRELQEELSVDVRESCLAPLAFASHDYDTFHLLMPLYVCRTWKGEVRATEGQALAWVRPARLADYPMPPADVPLTAILRDWL